MRPIWLVRWVRASEDGETWITTAVRVTAGRTSAQQRTLWMVSSGEYNIDGQCVLGTTVPCSKCSGMAQQEIMTKSQLPSRKTGGISEQIAWWVREIKKKKKTQTKFHSHDRKPSPHRWVLCPFFVYVHILHPNFEVRKMSWEEKKPWKLFPGISPRNEWWIEPGNNFKSHFLCSCEVIRLLRATLWALEWMKMAQNTPKVYHWFAVIDGWSCLIVLYCQTIHHSKQTLHSTVQYAAICGQRLEDLSFFPTEQWVVGWGRKRTYCFLLQNYKIVVC